MAGISTVENRILATKNRDTLAADIALPLAVSDLSSQAVQRMREDFLAITSHELRTPLTSLRRSLELCQIDDLFEQTVLSSNRLRRQRESSYRLHPSLQV